MDSFEANKIFGAVLGTVFVVFGGSLLAEGLYHSEVPETAGYAIVAAEAPAAGEGGEAVAAVPVATLLASADAARGEAQFKKCASCHAGEQGGENKVGPALWGVVNRPIASHEGFAYSAALTAFSEGGAVAWDFEHLNGFITSPKGYVTGTSMGFAGLRDDADRADLLAYLRTLSDSP
ncbi:MAG: cytochrome c family protein, partial [Rhizobiaceae bacterium]|nr:cytochrome c family protein [Rhizobiaceae bacterium]